MVEIDEHVERRRVGQQEPGQAAAGGHDGHEDVGQPGLSRQPVAEPSVGVGGDPLEGRPHGGRIGAPLGQVAEQHRHRRPSRGRTSTSPVCRVGSRREGPAGRADASL
jgi:hypothetical protein